MTKCWQPTLSAEDQADFDAWVATRPSSVRVRIESHPPGLYYNRAYPGGQQIVLILSYSEDTDTGACDTCIVGVRLDFNAAVFFERDVFGVRFDDLEPVIESPDEVRERVNSERHCNAAAVRISMGFDPPMPTHRRG